VEASRPMANKDKNKNRDNDNEGKAMGEEQNNNLSLSERLRLQREAEEQGREDVRDKTIPYADDVRAKREAMLKRLEEKRREEAAK
jgi:hypothetical protein